jgi:uncharacterized protein YggU (UPF0235/DUF167 family)
VEHVSDVLESPENRHVENVPHVRFVTSTFVDNVIPGSPAAGLPAHEATPRTPAIMISLEQTANGIRIPVKAQANARRNGITGEHAGALKVAVTQAPEKGKANDAIAAVLAEWLDLKHSQIELVSGPTSSLKTFLVAGISCDELRQRITLALAHSQ